MMNICETASEIVCQPSFLKSYDIRLKKYTKVIGLCSCCDLSSLEEDTTKHVVMQCPKFQNERDELLNEIRAIPSGIGHVFLNNVNVDI